MSDAQSFAPIGRLSARVRKLRNVVRLRPFDTSTDQGRSLERYRRIAITTLTGLFARGIGMFVGLFSVPLALSALGKEQYGLWAAITSLLAWVALFNFGIANGLLNSLSEAYGRDDKEAAAKYVSTAFFLLLGATALLTVVFIGVVRFVPWEVALATRGAIPSFIVRRAVVVAIAIFLASMPLTVLPQIYAAYQKTYVANIVTVASSLVTLLSVLVVVHMKLGLASLIVAFSGSALLISALNFVYLIRVEMPWLRPRSSLFGMTALRRLAATSVPLFLFQIGALLVNQSQLFVLAHRVNYNLVADYSILMRVYLALMGLISLSTGAFIPSFRESYERGETEWMGRAFRRQLILRMTMAAAASLVLMFAGNWLIRVWLRQANVQFDQQVWYSASLCLLVATWGATYSDALSVLDQIWILVGFVMVNSVVTVALTWVLSPQFGAFGSLLAVTATSLLIWSWCGPLILNSRIKARQSCLAAAEAE